MKNPDEAAVVVDNHTGKVRSYYLGMGAKEDAEAFQHQCKSIDCLKSTSVITGEAAKKAMKKGRV